MSVASIIDPSRGTILPHILPHGIGHFFSTYPPNILEEVKNNSGKVIGTRSKYAGLTYSELISRIESLEQSNRELRAMIETPRNANNNARSEGWYSAKSSHSSRKTRKTRRY